MSSVVGKPSRYAHFLPLPSHSGLVQFAVRRGFLFAHRATQKGFPDISFTGRCASFYTRGLPRLLITSSTVPKRLSWLLLLCLPWTFSWNERYHQQTEELELVSRYAPSNGSLGSDDYGSTHLKKALQIPVRPEQSFACNIYKDAARTRRCKDHEFVFQSRSYMKAYMLALHL